MKKTFLLIVFAAVAAVFVVVGCTKNTPPVIDSLSADTLVTQGSSVTITCTATDDDDDALEYDWEASGGDFDAPMDSSVVVWIAPYEAGSYTITCMVSDGTEEDDVSETITITVAEDYFPRDMGYKWYYLDAFVNAIGADDTLFFDAEVVEVDTTADGVVWGLERHFYTAGTVIDQTDTLSYTISADSVTIDDPEFGEYLGLVLPLWVDKTWDTGEGGTGTITESGDVSVPDGDYTDCFHVAITGGDIERDFWLAPQVGMVTTAVTIADTMDFELELWDHDF